VRTNELPASPAVWSGRAVELAVFRQTVRRRVALGAGVAPKVRRASFRASGGRRQRLVVADADDVVRKWRLPALGRFRRDVVATIRGGQHQMETEVGERRR